MTNLFASDIDGAKALVEKYEALRKETAKVIVGQQDIIHDTCFQFSAKDTCFW